MTYPLAEVSVAIDAGTIYLSAQADQLAEIALSPRDAYAVAQHLEWLTESPPAQRRAPALAWPPGVSVALTTEGIVLSVADDNDDTVAHVHLLENAVARLRHELQISAVYFDAV